MAARLRRLVLHRAEALQRSGSCGQLTRLDSTTLGGPRLEPPAPSACQSRGARSLCRRLLVLGSRCAMKSKATPQIAAPPLPSSRASPSFLPSRRTLPEPCPGSSPRSKPPGSTCRVHAMDPRRGTPTTAAVKTAARRACAGLGTREAARADAAVVLAPSSSDAPKPRRPRVEPRALVLRWRPARAKASACDAGSTPRRRSSRRLRQHFGGSWGAARRPRRPGRRAASSLRGAHRRGGARQCASPLGGGRAPNAGAPSGRPPRPPPAILIPPPPRPLSRPSNAS